MCVRAHTYTAVKWTKAVFRHRQLLSSVNFSVPDKYYNRNTYTQLVVARRKIYIYQSEWKWRIDQRKNNSMAAKRSFLRNAHEFWLPGIAFLHPHPHTHTNLCVTSGIAVCNLCKGWTKFQKPCFRLYFSIIAYRSASELLHIMSVCKKLYCTKSV